MHLIEVTARMAGAAVALLIAGTAAAADVTEMPPALSGDGWISYEGELGSGSLVEEGAEVGRRTTSRHDVTVGVEFAPHDLVAAWLALETTAAMGFAYPDAPRMLYDPVTGSGTYVDAEASGEEVAFTGSGLTGLWLGAGVRPMKADVASGTRATYRVDVGLRTPDRKNTFWSADGGTRGAAPGGVGWLLAAAFSTEFDHSSPYITARYQAESRTQLDVVDEDGVVWIDSAILKPANELDVTAGVELFGSGRPELGQRAGADLFFGFGYRSWQDVPSGLYLPEVLEASRSLVVTTSEYAIFRVGLALNVHFSEAARMRLGADVRLLTPHRLESAYDVRTGADTVALGLFATVRGGFRQKTAPAAAATPATPEGGTAIKGPRVR